MEIKFRYCNRKTEHNLFRMLSNEEEYQEKIALMRQMDTNGYCERQSNINGFEKQLRAPVVSICLLKIYYNNSFRFLVKVIAV